MQSNNKLIKNTIVLYARMLLNIIIGLYTSRIILQTLGVSDYGIYNVVGGIVTLIGIINTAMLGATQRYISFEIGTKNKERLHLVFSTSVIIHLLLAIIIFVIAETIGWWFINNHLNIEANRMYAANWVYHCSIITMILGVLSVPYNSCIVAHEHMTAFAYIGIVEVLLKLFSAYALLVISGDKLIIYSLLILFVAFIIRLAYGIYCKKKFQECKYKFTFDRKLFKEMFSFASWCFIGVFGINIKEQGCNIILNIFLGTTINAARGIAMQVNGVINNFSNNFVMALNPQITKSYAEGNIQRSTMLVYEGCKYSFYLMAFISIPVLINIDYILSLWLTIVPQYTIEFIKFYLLAAMLNAIAPPIVNALQATGKIAVFQITMNIVFLSELPFAYWILKMGYKPYLTMLPTVTFALLALFIRFFILKKQVPSYKFKYFSIQIVGKCILIASITYVFSKYIHELLEENISTLILTSLLSCSILCILVYTFAISKHERNFINNKILQICKINK